MEKKMESIIHVHIYKPHKPCIFGKNSKNEKSELHVYTCKEKQKCDAFKNGHCINVGNIFGSRCPIGSKSITTGFSQRAKKYHEQLLEWESKYSEYYNALKQAPKRITKVPGGWVLPYSFMGSNKNIPFDQHSSLFSQGCLFLNESDFNKQNINSIVNYHATSMMGGVITEYKEKIIPKFLHDLITYYPSKFDEFFKDDLNIINLTENLNFVGREAYLTTIKPNVDVVIAKHKWFWDGVKITKKNSKFMIFEPCEWEECVAEFTPKKSAIIKITSNDQVVSSTKFAD